MEIESGERVTGETDGALEDVHRVKGHRRHRAADSVQGSGKWRERNIKNLPHRGQHIHLQWNTVVRSWQRSNVLTMERLLGLCALFILSAVNILPGRPRQKVDPGTSDGLRNPNHLAIDGRWHLVCAVGLKS